MLIILSPAKSLDLETPVEGGQFSQPAFLGDARKLVQRLKAMNPEQLSELMDMSSRLATLNHQRFADWHTPFGAHNARPAIFTFVGDVYQGFNARQLSPADLAYAQDHLRILSGLYGILRPLDLMQAYRLEMGTSLGNERGQDLYAFWRDKLTRSINRDLAKEQGKILVNLASNEYFNALQADRIDGTLITPAFKDFSNGKYRFLSFYAKQARGSMAAWIVRQRIEDPGMLRKFAVDGYRYSAEESTPAQPVFLRRRAA